MMLHHLGEPEAARAVEAAFEAVLADSELHTPDLGGNASTSAVGEAIAMQVSAAAA
jgi:tartrate dehydrogenase/decarboxylase / D-malate dehydrogenase